MQQLSLGLDSQVKEAGKAGVKAKNQESKRCANAIEPLFSPEFSSNLSPPFLALFCFSYPQNIYHADGTHTELDKAQGSHTWHTAGFGSLLGFGLRSKS